MSDSHSKAGFVGSISAIGDGKGAIRMEDVYDTNAEDLWSALTDPDRLAVWIGAVAGDLRVGGTFHARFTSGWEVPGRVEICRQPERLLVVMAPDSADETQIEATLTPAGDHNVLVVDKRGIPIDHLPGHRGPGRADVGGEVLHVGLPSQRRGRGDDRSGCCAPRRRDVRGRRRG